MRPFLVRVAAIVLWLPLALPSAASDQSTAPTDTLRWVRARLVAVSPESLTLALRDSHLTLTRDPSAGPAPSVGSIVEVHYGDRNHIRRAVLVFASPGLSDEMLSKRPGRSFRGKVTRVGKSTLRLEVDGKRRDLTLDRKSTLVEKDRWAAAASGTAGVLSRVQLGELLLVKYAEESNDLVVGDITLGGTDLKVIEVRRLL